MISIAFVYDLEFCKTETDDVYSAILYFHPSWVILAQRFSLCGQLMGVLQFVTECFSRPKLISLQNGKFVIKRYGRFVLAIGTDRYIEEKILMHRANLLINIFELYHYSIPSLYELFDDRVRFADKLYHIFETHLPLLQYNGNLLQNIYKLHLPKSASNLYLDAIQILENCQKSNVLGGILLYHNKVLATQLSDDLTKILVTTDPQRIRTTGEMINVNYHQPNGCHLIKIYIKLSELNRLKRQIKRSTLSTQNAQNSLPFIIKKKPKDQPFLMKPSKSIIFTNIPEEEALIEVPSPIEPPPEMKPMRNLKPRPNHLPLKFKTIQSKDIPESGIASINFDETDSFPDFIGRTSVCSTPMTENKLLVGPMLSIFANNEKDISLTIQEEPTIAPRELKNAVVSPKKFEEVYINFACNPFKQFQRKSSWSELNHISELEENTEILLEPCYNVYNTISDPTCVIFNQKRMPLSKAMFEDFHTLSPIKNNKIPVASPEKAKKPKSVENSPKKMNTNNKIKSSRKKMLMLPLKSLTTDKELDKTTVTTGSLILESPSLSKNFMGSLQLTPLMSKLTLLAMNENDIHSSGFSSFEMQTPTTNYYSNLETPIDNKFFLSRLKNEEEAVEDESDEMVKVDLFICGQQNMSLILIMDENSSSSQTLVQSMFDLCVARLNRLEMKLNDIININVDNGDKSSNDYSFINLDKKWEILKRGGGWQLSDLQSLLLMHNSFEGNTKMTDIILRSDEAVLYGYQCGETEIFYQEPSQKQAGLPPPTDKMGTISSAAKRRLERDHSLVLF